ncbi:MAG: triose-phosphate isomerase [Pseudomonadota bacterium]|uniref:triose-phosphate isomerase n=1 Tax=Roseovarius TaxID=74030 RepID=UPI0022A887FC|nr:triose-phosphate isomerase [Roseovarius sp. EGI FJ00037]MCZ0813939.1 triose-phosphate isomerase [Roseovarius sp. EGI FJ00037]
MRKLAAGNWKMNGTREALDALQAMTAAHPDPAVDILICPPATLLLQAAALSADTPLLIGAQDCHSAPSGAHTGDISAPMIADAGAQAVIVGHSERRQDHGETDALVRAKASAAHAAGLMAIICLGETLDERNAGRTLDVIGAQLDGSTPDSAESANTVIAYEPVWAIGTGKIADMKQISEVHDFIRENLISRLGETATGIRILYGGSVKPANAADIFAVGNVDGALVGGASLTAADFSPIIAALEAAT